MKLYTTRQAAKAIEIDYQRLVRFVKKHGLDHHHANKYMLFDDGQLKEVKRRIDDMK
jgi:phage antirepressor YoqD-like protein